MNIIQELQDFISIRYLKGYGTYFLLFCEGGGLSEYKNKASLIINLQDCVQSHSKITVHADTDICHKR